MSTRPVYISRLKRPYYETENFDFEWNPGQSAVQKQKNSLILQDLWKQKHPDGKILEVSTKSDQEMGKRLSPFNLTLRLPSLRKEFPVENIYQASKVFRQGGPYVDLLGGSPLEAKSDPRLRDSGKIVHFLFEKEKYPGEPDDLFYLWLYLRALMENRREADAVKRYDAFCDIEFNPAKGRNNQAKACAVYKSLFRLGLLDKAKDFEQFKRIMYAEDISSIEEPTGKEEGPIELNDLRQNVRRSVFPVGTWISHPTIGRGEVIRRTPDSYIVRFLVSGPKTLTRDFVEQNCKKIG